jgi:ABC-type arginine transport system permease subunit
MVGAIFLIFSLIAAGLIRIVEARLNRRMVH